MSQIDHASFVVSLRELKARLVAHIRPAVANWWASSREWKWISSTPVVGLAMLAGLVLTGGSVGYYGTSVSALTAIGAVAFACAVALALRPRRVARQYIRLRQLQIGAVAGYAGCTYLLVSLVGAPFPRRLVFFTCMWPIVFFVTKGFIERARHAGYHRALAYALVWITFIMGVLPGGYFPPFYDGIAGWIVKLPRDQPETYSIKELQIMNSEGQYQWYSKGISLPITFKGRFWATTYAKYGEAGWENVARFFMQLYCHHYPILKDGRMANQRYLGPFSYPGHTPARPLDYSGFPPESVVALQYVDMTYELPSGSLMDRKIILSAPVTIEANNGTCVVR